jgi:hypothetical protein
MIPTGWADAGAATAAGAAAIAAAAAPAANKVVMYFGRIRMVALLRLPGWPRLASLSNNDQRQVCSNPSLDRTQETHAVVGPVLRIDHDELHLVIDGPPDDGAQIRAQFDEQIAKIEKYLGWSRQQIEGHNERVRSDVPKLVA